MSLSSDPRPSPFTVQEFSELVCSAFNLNDADRNSPLIQPLLSLAPDPHEETHTHGGFDDKPPDECGQELGPPNLDNRSRSRTITALQVFHQVRTRASAFVLRSRAPSSRSPSLPPFEPLPHPSLSLSGSASSFSRALSPWSMVDYSRERPRSRAESLPRSLRAFTKRDSSPPPLPGQHSRSGSSSGTRSPTPVLRSFFDDSPASKRAYSRPSTSSSVHPLSRVTTSDTTKGVVPMESLPSFFEDTGYQVAKPPAPSYSRPATPLGSFPQVHTRLPPLRKSKSGSYGVLGREDRRRNSKSEEERRRFGLVCEDSWPWHAAHDYNTPASFTSPRNPPPVPDIGARVLSTFSEEEVEMPMPPSYVFERRGSAASNSTGSTRSTSSLSGRLSNLLGLALPSKMRMRGRSKLNLTVATGSEESSADSSPSTLSSISSPSTPSSPTSTFSRSQAYVYAASADGHTWHTSVNGDREEEALAIGRVLTPEADPFAKADITIPTQGTPRPPTPPLPRRASSQHSPTSLNRTSTWDYGKPPTVKRTRNSLPASPVSTAYTFPSTCSVYTGSSPGSDHFSPAAAPSSTPNRQGPPSAWSSSAAPPGFVTPSSPTRSPSHASRSGPRRDAHSSRAPVSSDFPLPPTGLPPLPSWAATPTTVIPPPLPPKDRSSYLTYAHKSLPPTPLSLSDYTSPVHSCSKQQYRLDIEESRPTSIVHLTKVVEGCSLDPQAQLLEVGLQGTSGYLREVRLEQASQPESLSRPVTPVMIIRPAVRRRSVDSTSTVTASPSSSALHDGARNRDCDASTSHDARLVFGVSDNCLVPSSLSSSPTKSFDEDEDFWNPGASCTTLFYSARSSIDSGSFSSCQPGEDRTRSLEAHPTNHWHVPGRRAGKAASAGPCA